LNTEQPKERRRHGESFNLLGLRARTHVERHAAECRGFLECVETAAPGRIADRRDRRAGEPGAQDSVRSPGRGGERHDTAAIGAAPCE
jgi:hypothetical protein